MSSMKIASVFYEGFLSLQDTKYFNRFAQQNLNVQTLPNVKVNLFGPQTWSLVNGFANELNAGMTEMGKGQNMSGAPLSFQTIINNRSQLSGLSGSVKNLASLIDDLYSIIVVVKPEPYSIEEAKKMANDFKNQVNGMSFTEPGGQGVKTSLLNSLTAWTNGLDSAQ